MGCWLFPINSKVIIYTSWILLLNGDMNISHFFEWVVDWSPLIQNVLFVLSEYWYWIMLRMYLIMLEYLLVLIVDVWTSKIVNWFNLFVEAMNDLRITIVENMNILNRIILLVMETKIVFYWNYMEWAN